VQLPPGLSPVAQATLSNPTIDLSTPNQRVWRAAEIPAVNGQGNGRSLARIYGALARGGELDGVTLLGIETLRRATMLRTDRPDLVLPFPRRWAAGFVLNTPPIFGPDVASFGHSGAGGSFAFADPTRKLGVGYAMNQMGSNLQGDPRAVSLVKSVYECIV
jgi:CubicO group peptidase (beta-lactamase class C family)